MKLAAALQLHNQDYVTVKKTGMTSRVVEIEITPKEHTTNNMTCVDIRLDDGNWYGYKEVK